MPTPEPATPPSPPLPPARGGWWPPAKPRRQWLAAILWGAAMALLYPLGPSYKFIFFMPLGLWGYLPRTIEEREGWFLALGWGVYSVVLTVYFRCRSPRVFWWVFALLALLLATNVGGCYYLNTH